MLIIGDSINAQSRHNFAKSVTGIDVVEPVEIKDIVQAASDFDNFNGLQLVESVLKVLSSIITKVEKSNLLKRIKSIISNSNRKPPSPIEILCLDIIQSNTIQSILNLFIAFEDLPESHIYRRSAFYTLKEALLLSTNDNRKLQDCVIYIREKRRQVGDRRIPNKAVGSTLLLKGLESDHAFILNASNMNSKHLYVAISRGAKSITVCSSNSLIG